MVPFLSKYDVINYDLSSNDSLTQSLLFCLLFWEELPILKITTIFDVES